MHPFLVECWPCSLPASKCNEVPAWYCLPSLVKSPPTTYIPVKAAPGNRKVYQDRPGSKFPLQFSSAKSLGSKYRSKSMAPRKIKMTYSDAYVRQIYTMALNKNTSAARLLEQLRTQFPSDALPGDPIVFAIYKEDADL